MPGCAVNACLVLARVLIWVTVRLQVLLASKNAHVHARSRCTFGACEQARALARACASTQAHAFAR
eukprot:4217319-Alexandrium_andersonii.AAC.1